MDTAMTIIWLKGWWGGMKPQRHSCCGTRIRQLIWTLDIFLLLASITLGQWAFRVSFLYFAAKNHCSGFSYGRSSSPGSMSCRHFCRSCWSLESFPSRFPCSCDLRHLSFRSLRKSGAGREGCIIFFNPLSSSSSFNHAWIIHKREILQEVVDRNQNITFSDKKKKKHWRI